MGPAHDASSPPPSPVPPAPRSQTGRHAALPSATGEPVDERALRIALEARTLGMEHADRIDVLEASIGAPANPIAKTPATGFVLAVEELTKAIGDLRTELRSEKDAREGAARLAAQKREPWGWALKIIVGTAISTAVGAALIALGAWLARHWH